MKITDLQKIDQNIIKILADHKGIDKAINGKMLAQSLNVDFRTLQGRIAFLQGKGCAIGSIDNIGYFAPTNEEERTKGITKKENMAYSTLKAVMGVRSVSLDWLDEMID
ncbi:helix-turn-helix domain-containing protein [Lactococcus lactis subsp. lactis]|uniref:HTH domain-containing protein n=1 Tax=Lactococcus lactis TaxID=1358 RepID=UPI002078F3C7|nr:HTH domain-containing protein [Lactococcus lactis]MDM7533581.1 HTH domain-containing protein [Lactococcus lactis]USI63507.1 helix-turn-helix domain-containing protein [Lactococcus lactis subsp. lactis]